MLLLKILLVPTILYLISLAGRIFGPAISGLLGGLPVIAGPILLFLYFDQSPEFATRATLGALASVSSLAGFCFVFGKVSRSSGTALSLLSGVLAFLVLTAGFTYWEPSANAAFALALFSIGCGHYFLPQTRPSTTPYSVPNKEILFRMVAAGILVLAITGASTILGPRLSGLLAPFPIAGTILAGFTQYFYGHDATVTLLKGFLRGLVGMAVFDYALVSLSPTRGFETSFAIAIVCALLIGVSITKAWSAYSTR